MIKNIRDACVAVLIGGIFLVLYLALDVIVPGK
jgi:hypothetical protein